MASRDGLMELDCAPTVHESNVFMLLGIALSEKQIPRFVGNVVSLRAEEGAVGVEFGAPKAGALLARDHNKNNDEWRKNARKS